MKITISTKNLSEIIKEAIVKNCMSFTISSQTNQIVFGDNKIVAKCNIMKHFTSDECESFISNEKQMFKLLTFLNMIMDQSIYVEFIQYDKLNLGIILTGFSHVI